MADKIIASDHHLDYPLYACQFDPLDSGRLIVAGGGGPSKTGVDNKITLLNPKFEDRTIYHTSEQVLSKDEDNVTCLAVGQRIKGKTSLVYAGINSSPDDQGKGKNEHFRVFGVDQVSRSKAALSPKIAELSRTALFSTEDTDTYQRILRTSPLYEDSTSQLGAVATGLSKKPQIAIFDLPSTGSSTAPKLRGRIDLAKEANDLDIIQTGPDAYQLAYCDDYEINLVNVSKTGAEDPHCAFTQPHDESAGAIERPAFRAMRYLTPSFVLSAANLPKRTGVILSGFRLHGAQATGSEAAAAEGTFKLAASAKLPRSVTMTTNLAVRNLSPPAGPGARQADTQFVIAVAGADNSISLYTIDFTTLGGIDLIANLHPFATIPAAHELQMTALAFSHFNAPLKSTARTMYIHLASVSVKNSVAVHSIPLRKVIDSRPLASTAAKNPASKRSVSVSGPPRTPRYVIALKATGQAPIAASLVLIIGFAILAIVMQSYLELHGWSKPIVHAHRFTPRSWQGVSTPPRIPKALAEMVSEKVLGNAPVVLSGGPAIKGDGKGVQVEAHDESVHGPAVKWDELPPEQQDAWKNRLKDAGHWGEEMGETIFKGILFSEIAGIVGNIVGG